MSIFSSPGACPSSRPPLAGITRFAGFGALVLWLPLIGCGLHGVEPEEIDLNVADDSESGGASGADTGDTGEAGTDGNESADDSGGDGDGDPNSGDGDGDGETTGDGDGDTPCDDLTLAPVVEGVNEIEVLDGLSKLEGSCGGAGPEAGYFYTATADGLVQFTLIDAAFEGAVYLIDPSCEEIACEPAPHVLEYPMTEGETVYILIDSFSVGGIGSLEINLI